MRKKLYNRKWIRKNGKYS